MRALAAALLALALLGAQSLARVHGLEHLAGVPVGLAADGAHGTHDPHGAHDSLWGHGQASGACLLLDELVSSQAPSAAAPRAAGPGPCQAAPDLTSARAPGAVFSRPYLARAPPAD